MNRNILEMKNINKSFSSVKVLDDVHFVLKEGTVHALVGGNGAGKSTLMKILTGVYIKDSGTVKVYDEEVDFHTYGQASNNGIRMIFQELSIISTMTVAENIYLNQEKKKGILIDEKKMVEEADLLLNKFGIDIDPNETMSNLSVGYCQLVEIAKALSKKAKVLVMDEPTASLSESEVKVLFEIVRNLKQEGVSIVYISHRMNEILAIADEVTILRDGKNIATKRAVDLNIESIIDYMMGEKAEKAFEWQERNYKGSKDIMLDVKSLEVNNWVKNISFTLRQGEVVGFAGLMGSGRTEILLSLFGLTKHKGGEIILKGKKEHIRCVQDAIDAGFALVPEDRRRQGLVLDHTVKQNVVLPFLKKLKRGLFVSEKESDKIVEQSVIDLNIKTDGILKQSKLLSGGNQQKVVLAKWLKNDPEILLLDEPTAGIDVGAKGEVINIIREFANSGKSVIIVSSEIAELMAVCDRLIILKKGKITGEVNREEIKSEEVIQHAIQE